MHAIRIAHTAAALLFSIAALSLAHAQSAIPLQLEKTIPLPEVRGRIDHMAFDSQHQRLFVAALGNDTVEVIDIKTGKVAHSISGLAEPQGTLYQADENRIWIANGRDGTVRIFDGSIFQSVRSINLGDDADNIRFDAATNRILVGYGSGAIAVFDADANKVADIKLDAHPESFQIEKTGHRLFVNLPRSQKVAVIDLGKSAIVATWPINEAHSNFPMALDEANGRLFLVCRNPATLLVLDTKSGAVVAKLPTVGDSDDVFYDQARKHIYVTGGGGAIITYLQQDHDRYIKINETETIKGARTSLFVPDLSRLFVAVPREGSNPAAIRIFTLAN